LNSIKIETPVPSEEVVDLSENLNDDFISIDDKTILMKMMLHLQKYCYKWPAIMVLRQFAYQGETGYKYAKKYKPKRLF
jgi:hypothetical protein